MNVDENNLALLEQIQQVDLILLRSRKKLKELPQRDRILELRKKKEAIEEKKAVVESLRKKAEGSLALIQDEDERLKIKQQETQDKVNEVQGDYRAVESLTRELGGIAKRRNTLESEMGPVSEKLAEIEKLEQQVDEALKQVNDLEVAEIAIFQQEGGALNSHIGDGEKRRKEIEKTLDSTLFKLYEKAAKRSGGIALAELIEGSCSVCRSVFEEGRLLQIHSEAPLSECPVCKRLLVVRNA